MTSASLSVAALKRIVPGSYPEADFILVAYGTNARLDGNYKLRVEEFFAALNQEFPKKPVFVILPIHRIGEETETDRLPLPEARAHITKVCGQYPNITLLDGTKFVPWDLSCYYDGFLHPNDLGMTHFAMNLTEQLQKHLGEKA